MGDLGDDEVFMWEALVRNKCGTLRLIKIIFLSWKMFTCVLDDLPSISFNCFEAGEDDSGVEDIPTAAFCVMGMDPVTWCTRVKVGCLTKNKIDGPIDILPDLI